MGFHEKIFPKLTFGLRYHNFARFHAKVLAETLWFYNKLLAVHLFLNSTSTTTTYP